MKIRCPNCNQKLKFDDDLSGLTLECPRCHGQFEAKAPVAIADVAAKEQTPVQISPKLTKCKHCGKEIASNCFKCVHCGGWKILDPAVVLFWFFLIFLYAVGYGFVALILALIFVVINSFKKRSGANVVPTSLVIVALSVTALIIFGYACHHIKSETEKTIRYSEGDWDYK